MELKVCFLGAVRRRTFICCRNIQISVSSAARDRKQICDHPNKEPDKISHPATASPDSRSTASQIEFAIGTGDKAVVGILSGSLSEGGSYGWAIPARRAIALIHGQTLPRTPSSIFWDPIPLRSANLRTTEYFVRRNEISATQLSAFVQKTNRLSAINDALDIGLKEVSLSNIATGLRVQWETPRSNVLGPLTVQEVNSYAQTYLQVDYSFLRNEFGVFRTRLLERYAIDRELRGSVSKLREAANRSDLDSATSQRIKLAVGRVIDDQQDIAADTYERRYAVDTQNLVAALDRLSRRPPILQFSSLADARAFVADLETCSIELNKHTFSSPFMAWRLNENRFFTSVGSVLKNFEPIIVYVPN